KGGGWIADPRGAARRGHGRCAAAPATEGDDGGHGRRGIVAAVMVHAHRGGVYASLGGAGAGRNAQLAGARAHRDAGDFYVAAGEGDRADCVTPGISLQKIIRASEQISPGPCYLTSPENP